MTQAYPLAWPEGWKRTLPAQRQNTRFSTTGRQLSSDGKNQWRVRRDLTIDAAMRRLSDELERLGAADIVLSSNLERRLDGQPRSNQKMPDDPGIAVYFKRKAKPIVLACDAWTTPAGNIAAIAGHIDAIRRMERYGVGSLDRVFTGYAALPPPGHVHQRPWWQVFGYASDAPVALSDVESTYRHLARLRHPDAGGSHAQMAELTAAIAEARKVLAQAP